MSLMAIESPRVSEDAIAFPNLSSWISKELGIPKPHISTLHRWRISGARGVTLPTFLVGSRRYCRPADVRSFLQKINSN